jgi:hypothetical protein
MTTYQQDALRTLSDKYHIGAIDPDLLHGALGLATESGELLEGLLLNGDTVNAHEELGDTTWYIPPICKALGITIDEVEDAIGAPDHATLLTTMPTLIDVAMRLCIEAGHVQDAIKRAVYYGSPLNSAGVVNHLGRIIHLIRHGCYLLDTTHEKVKATNISKLKARFPQRFTEAEAIQRDVSNERLVLEGGVA